MGDLILFQAFPNFECILRLGVLKAEKFSSELDSGLQSSKSKEKQLRSVDKISKYNFNNSKVFGFNKKLFSVYYVRVGLETAIV